MEKAEIREMILAFVSEEILRDFGLKEGEEVNWCGYMNTCEIRPFSIDSLEAFIFIHCRRWKEKNGRESFFNTYNHAIEEIKRAPKFAATI